jgi:hypothetical protein
MRITITVGMGHIGFQPPGHNGGDNHLKAETTGTLEQRNFVGIPDEFPMPIIAQCSPVGWVLYGQFMVNVMTSHVSACNNVLASCKSAVSNPSVNQP